jgi:hypothetical protein
MLPEPKTNDQIGEALLTLSTAVCERLGSSSSENWAFQSIEEIREALMPETALQEYERRREEGQTSTIDLIAYADDAVQELRDDLDRKNEVLIKLRYNPFDTEYLNGIVGRVK